MTNSGEVFCTGREPWSHLSWSYPLVKKRKPRSHEYQSNGLVLFVSKLLERKNLHLKEVEESFFSHVLYSQHWSEFTKDTRSCAPFSVHRTNILTPRKSPLSPTPTPLRTSPTSFLCHLSHPPPPSAGDARTVEGQAVQLCSSPLTMCDSTFPLSASCLQEDQNQTIAVVFFGFPKPSSTSFTCKNFAQNDGR